MAPPATHSQVTSFKMSDRIPRQKSRRSIPSNHFGSAAASTPLAQSKRKPPPADVAAPMATKNTVGVRVLDYPSSRRKLEELKQAQQVAAVSGGTSGKKKGLWFADKEAKVQHLRGGRKTEVYESQ